MGLLSSFEHCNGHSSLLLSTATSYSPTCDEAMIPHPASFQSKASQRGRGGVEVETVAKELGSLSAEQRDAALLADAPELLVLLQVG